MTLYPTLTYRDAHRAIDWLGDAFGCESRMVVDGENGAVAHAELALEGSIFMLGSADRDDEFGGRAGTGALYAAVADPDALCARAREGGAEITRDVRDTEYGSREFTCRDLEGNVWSFGTYRP
jgi:uncharacterized glyoxalase superfamily protein PhnB